MSTPADHTSTLWSAKAQPEGFLISGAINPLVPTGLPEANQDEPSHCSSIAKLKSIRTVVVGWLSPGLGTNKTLVGEMSRWITPRWCMSLMACARAAHHMTGHPHHRHCVITTGEGARAYLQQLPGVIREELVRGMLPEAQIA
jgi:hypothetical protein